ncbi:hypothetical protein M752DRAFT_265987 [Aspergillus phoenicis ATCC 13157]|uniref:Uncharacterized protein n=1 Tax=Aspergillus phoenicis ATCC 13157 TaxID=1353007 RepID=A0A370PLQ1_ASPPH|nr:hypothetical protein M752DRAFT_265987 [Aspergillus phoenicis ATCC 13157]
MTDHRHFKITVGPSEGIRLSLEGVTKAKRRGGAIDRHVLYPTGSIECLKAQRITEYIVTNPNSWLSSGVIVTVLETQQMDWLTFRMRNAEVQERCCKPAAETLYFYYGVDLPYSPRFCVRRKQP